VVFGRRNFQKFQDGQRGDGFAAAAFTHQAQYFPLPQLERDPVDGLYHSFLEIEVNLKILTSEEFGPLAASVSLDQH
jgi:hypothetical protein